MNILSALIGTFFGGIIAFVTSLVIEWTKRDKELKDNSKKLFLIMMNNNNVIKGIKQHLDNNSGSFEDKYNDIFGRYNFNYAIHPIDTYFVDIQAYLYKKYKRPIMTDYGTLTPLYYLIFDIVKMQSLIVNLQNNPVKSEDTSSKEEIIKSFDIFYKQYKKKYSEVLDQKELKKLLKK